MKILFLTNRVPWPLKDGGALATYNHIRACADAGCEVTVLSFNTSKHYVANLPPQLISNCTWYTHDLDNRVKPVEALKALLSNTSYHASRFLNDGYQSKLHELIAKTHYDVVVFESVFMAHYLPVVRAHSRAFTVLRQHNVEWHIWNQLARQSKNILKKIYISVLASQLKRFEQSFLNAFDAIVPITQSDLRVFEEMGLNIPAHVYPVGIAMDSPERKISNTPDIFHLGSMEWMPNADALRWFLSEVWRKVYTLRPDLRFFAAGRGMPQHMQQQNIPGVHLIGEVDDALAFMEDKGIMIVPVFAGSGIRVKIIEGMALGKAIVTTSRGVEGIPALHRQHLMVADDAVSFANAIVELAGSKDLRNVIGQNARKLAHETYEINKITTDLLHFYTKHLKKQN